MSNVNKNKTSSIAIGNLNRNNLYELFIEKHTPSINVENIGNRKDIEASGTEGVRYKAEKLLFINLLLDCDLERQIEYRKNAKYDYMTGLLLFIASNPHFKYGFGYFLDYIQRFDDLLSNWCKFINAVISDVNSIDSIKFAKYVFIQFAGVLQIEFSGGLIIDIAVNIERFDTLFGKWNNRYDFDVIIGSRESDWNGRNIIFSGASDGCGQHSNLSKCIKRMNSYSEIMSHKRDMLISFTHEH
jgi:hypothetical protein